MEHNRATVIHVERHGHEFIARLTFESGSERAVPIRTLDDLETVTKEYSLDDKAVSVSPETYRALRVSALGSANHRSPCPNCLGGMVMFDPLPGKNRIDDTVWTTITAIDHSRTGCKAIEWTWDRLNDVVDVSNWAGDDAG